MNTGAASTATGSNFTINAPPPTRLRAAPSISGYQNTSGARITTSVAGSTIKVIG